MNRRSFLRGALAATAAGILVPEKRIWALDQTMLTPPSVLLPRNLEDALLHGSGDRVCNMIMDEGLFFPNHGEWGFAIDPGYPDNAPVWWYKVKAMGQDFDGRTWQKLWNDDVIYGPIDSVEIVEARTC
jgi:hypothetical protein